MTDWETRYYEAEALHTEANGMLTAENERLRRALSEERTLVSSLQGGIVEQTVRADEAEAACERQRELKMQHAARASELRTELEDVEADNRKLRAYAVTVAEAARLLIGVLTHPNADHTHYMDEVRMLEAALAKNPVGHPGSVTRDRNTVSGEASGEGVKGPRCHETGKESGLQKYERTLVERLRPQSNSNMPCPKCGEYTNGVVKRCVCHQVCKHGIALTMYDVGPTSADCARCAAEHFESVACNNVALTLDLVTAVYNDLDSGAITAAKAKLRSAMRPSSAAQEAGAAPQVPQPFSPNHEDGPHTTTREEAAPITKACGKEDCRYSFARCGRICFECHRMMADFGD